MTTEVGVMNKFGVALAADSALAVAPGDKIYQSAEKLFLLAENAPVGIMVYGNAYLVGVPWETIIKAYRRRLGRNTFSRLEDYVTDFVSFLSSADSFFEGSAQEHFLAAVSENIYRKIDANLDESLNTELEERDSLVTNDLKRVMSEVVEQELIHTKQYSRFHGLPEGFSQQIEDEYGDVIRSRLNESFGGFPSTSQTKRKLVQAVTEAVVRELHLQDIDSGIVVAGFGEDEHFPRLFELRFRGVLLDHLLFTRVSQIYIDDESRACVVPFGQKEMVQLFMRGVDPTLDKIIETLASKIFPEMVQIALQESKRSSPELWSELSQTVSANIDMAAKLWLQQWRKMTEEYYQNLIVMVGSLPKDELAYIAESLVYITKAKTRVSQQPDKVGGPIDVVAITKGDGFVWIKRKHYFRADLNPRFMSRYYREGGVA